MIAVDYVGGSTDGAPYSFALLVIIADMNGGGVIAGALADQPMPPLWPLHFCLQVWVRFTLFLSGRTEATAAGRHAFIVKSLIRCVGGKVLALEDTPTFFN